MAYSWQQVTSELITNWYLYGQATTPTDLTNDVWIRQSMGSDSIYPMYDWRNKSAAP